MSFFGRKPQPTSAEKIAAAETEIEMVSNMFNQYAFEICGVPGGCPKMLTLPPRLVETCTKKCIPGDYREADLNKGESVCLDRCVAKFFEVNVKVSEKMQGEVSDIEHRLSAH
jgi:mitochondrial import inner membrane translocase subunit TIM10